MNSLMPWKQMHLDRQLQIGAKVKYWVCFFSFHGLNLLNLVLRSIYDIGTLWQ